MILVAVGILSIQTKGSMVQVRPTDLITQAHIKAVLAKHHIRASTMGGTFYFIFTDINEPTLAGLLANEAPVSDYSASIKGYRHVSPDFPTADWRILTKDEESGSTQPPFNIGKLTSEYHIAPSEISQVKYVPRPYLDSDFVFHVGFDIVVKTKTSVRRFQLMSSKAEVMTEEFGVIGSEKSTFGTYPIKFKIGNGN